MVRGFCFRCHREVGGFRKAVWQCPSCHKLYCERCPRRTVGRFLRKLVCPECLVEMHYGGIPAPRVNR
ncbi:MAG: hypothetical protein OK456_06040 [Thaumarchaeota archaeon]|nr:hypothetical protein [Nitrososphaerota archaeon]